MTEDHHQIMQPSDNIHNMLPHESGGTGLSHGNHVETQRSTDPRNSLEDYNRTMLEYTQRQMSSFVDLDDSNRSSGGSSRSSQSSGNSGRSGVSSNGVLAGHANGPPPTSAGAAAAATAATRHGAHQYPGQKPMRSPNEAKPSRY